MAAIETDLTGNKKLIGIIFASVIVLLSVAGMLMPTTRTYIVEIVKALLGSLPTMI